MIGTRVINRFSEKFSVWANGPILGPKMAHPQNSGSINDFSHKNACLGQMDHSRHKNCPSS